MRLRKALCLCRAPPLRPSTQAQQALSGNWEWVPATCNQNTLLPCCTARWPPRAGPFQPGPAARHYRGQVPGAGQGAGEGRGTVGLPQEKNSRQERMCACGRPAGLPARGQPFEGARAAPRPMQRLPRSPLPSSAALRVDAAVAGLERGLSAALDSRKLTAAGGSKAGAGGSAPGSAAKVGGGLGGRPPVAQEAGGMVPHGSRLAFERGRTGAEAWAA